jgi:aarF domain-containing kinase
MKAGQLLSMDSSDLLPPEAIEVLSQLQNMADPLKFEDVQPVVQADLGQDKFEDLNLNNKPFAAASLGQVHKGLLQGQQVAVKIQYPGVRESIDADLKILKKMVSMFLTVSNKKIPLDALFEEFKRLLKQEADYVQENGFLNRYRKLVGSSSLQDQLIVPRTFDDYCSSRVLTMSFEDGLSLNQWLLTKPSLQDREKVGRWILDLYCHEFYRWGMVQTDPNYGNFLIQKDPLKMVLLDFGSTQIFEKKFVEDYKKVLLAFYSLDEKAMIEASENFNLLDPRESDTVKKYYADFMRLSIQPFMAEMQPFDFANADYGKALQDAGKRFTLSLKYSPPPHHIIFLHRKLGGLFNLLRKMEVRMDITPYWQKLIETEFAGPG